MVAVGSERSEAASQTAALGELRGRVLWGLVTFFALVMAIVTVAVWSAPGEDASLIGRLALLAVVLPMGMVGVTRLILGPAVQLEQMAEQFRTLYSQARLDALLDPITGLGNHRAFQEELHRQTADAARHGYPLALVMLDLDDLKRANDEYGHAGGDHLLAAMGRLLVSASRTADRAFRIGGDEFALLLPNADATAAHTTMTRILSAALGAESTFDRGFSFSAGISAFPQPSADGRLLIRNADAALYWAKRHGRTDIQVFDPDKHATADEARSVPELADALDQLIRGRSIIPVYQPIFDLVTGEACGYEGLVRPTPEAPFRDASALFTAAEVADRTVELDMLAIAVIAEGTADLPAAAYLSVNLSPRSLETDQFRVSELLDHLGRHGLDPKRVVLELTEREAIEDLAVLRSNLDACRAAGFRIAADDVGAGNAGLRLLSEIRFDIVKVDLSLVQGGVMRDSAVAVLRAIQDLSARSHATVVAEGIETVEQLEVIQEIGILRGQGYLLATPAPQVTAERIDLTALVTSHRQRRQALLDPWETLAS